MKKMERRGGHNRKVTPEQREQLLRVYLENGQEASATLCEQFGLSSNYARKTAGALGYEPEHPRYKCYATNHGKRISIKAELSA